MDVSRREVVKAAGITAAAVGLSAVACGSEEQEPETKGAETTTTEDRRCQHFIRISTCGEEGQYVVVESSTVCGAAEHRRTFKGRVDARWGEELVFSNDTGKKIRLYFPEGDVFEGGKPEPIEIPLDPGQQTPRRLGRKTLGGAYEFAVLYNKAAGTRLKPDWDSSEWGFAIGGSSPVIDIRI